MESLPIASPIAQLFFFLFTHAAAVVAGVVWARRKGQTYLDEKAAELVKARNDLRARLATIQPKAENALDRAKVEIEETLDKVEEALKAVKK
jgi:hypothetical protein